MSAADLVAQLAASGTPPELLAAVAKELFTAEAERAALAGRRRNERERKARSRDITGQNVTERDVTSEPLPLDKRPQTPKINPHPARNTGARKGTRLAEDFELPDDWKQWAMTERRWSAADAEAEGASFRDYWIGKAGKDATKADWPATWRNWVRNSRRASGSASATPAKPSSAMTPEQRAKMLELAKLKETLDPAEWSRRNREIWGKPPDAERSRKPQSVGGVAGKLMQQFQ